MADARENQATRARGALTARAVDSAKPDPQKRREIPDAALPGFYLIIQPSGARSWALRYRFGGKPKKLTIGPVLALRTGETAGELPYGAPMTLAEARQAAQRALRTLAEGRDPAGVKEAARAATRAATGDAAPGKDTIAARFPAFVDAYHKRERRNRSVGEIERQYRAEIAPHWAGRTVAEITRADVRDLLAGIVARSEAAGRRGVTANRVFSTLRRFFNWCVEQDVIDASPCEGVRKIVKEKPRERLLTPAEIGRVWRASGDLGAPFGSLYRLALLTGQRRAELSGMRWGELRDLGGDEPLWALPGDRVKNAVAHDVPLSALAVELIDAQPRIAAKTGRALYVFTTTGDAPVSGYSRSKARLDALILAEMRREAVAAGADPDSVEAMAAWGLHDARRTFASGLAALGVNLPVVERLLNHRSGSFAGIVAVYQHHEFADEKRAAMDAWAGYVAELGEGVPDRQARDRARAAYAAALAPLADAPRLKVIDGGAA